VIFAVMLDLNEAGKPIEPMAILAELTDRKELAKVGGAEYLHALLANPTVPASAGFYADRIKLLYRTRRAAQLAERLMQATQEVEPDRLQEAIAGMSIELNLLVDETDTAEVEGLSSWQDFMAVAPSPNDWVVKGLLERQDVVLFLSQSGIGKSWLSRQVSLCVAAGVHPFRFTPIPPKRTLLVDLENPTSALRRQSEAIFDQAERVGMPIGNRGHVWTFPQGFNLRKRGDALMLEQVVSEVRPDLMCLGSLYNAFDRGRDDWDTAAEQTKAVFNRIRQRYGTALWIEHHMPKQSGGGHVQNPFGSSIWERWPGFGRVLKQVGQNAYELATPFRGDRDARRDFPPGLYRGGEFPWTPIWDQAELDALREKK
jgi:replicative DNA helicase